MRESLWREPWWNAGRRAAPVGAAPHRKVRRMMLSVFRRSASFFLFVVCSPDGAQRNPGAALRASKPIPDCASLHPGYAPGMIVMKAGPTAGPG
jgi:hypothetical protein